MSSTFVVFFAQFIKVFCGLRLHEFGIYREKTGIEKDKQLFPHMSIFSEEWMEILIRVVKNVF